MFVPRLASFSKPCLIPASFSRGGHRVLALGATDFRDRHGAKAGTRGLRELREISRADILTDEGRARSLEQLAGSARRTAFHPLLDLAPQVFNRIEVWRLRRQVLQPCPGGLNGRSHARDLVGGQIVQDDPIVPLQPWYQSLFHPGQKQFATIGPSNSHGVCGPWRRTAAIIVVV